MQALVATTQYLLQVDLENKVITPLEAERPEYYGISWFPGGKELVLSHSGLDNADLTNISEYAQSEIGWISFGGVNTSPFISQPHQILCATDGRIVCANTGRNSVTVIDLHKPGYFQEARISPARWDRTSLEDIAGDHLNSIFEQRGKLYVLAHGHSNGSQLATFSYPELGLISLEAVPNRSGLHNIWLTEDGQKISCHSESGALVDLQSKSALWEAGLPVYLRGLAASEEVILIGESQKTGRDLRRSSLSGLWVIDRNSWRALDYLCLGPYGAVNEVRLLDVPDQAHHGALFAGISELRGNDMRLEMSRQRLATAAVANEARHLWRNFEFVFGAPRVGQKGERIAEADQLCLVINKTRAKDKCLSFDYSLNAGAGQSHISAVVGYQGRGGDSNMDALLLQPQGTTAALSFWQHDGKSWSSIPSVSANGFPLSGRLKVTSHKDHVKLSIEGQEVICLPAARLQAVVEPFGIRWIGASVKPCSESS